MAQLEKLEFYELQKISGDGAFHYPTGYVTRTNVVSEQWVSAHLFHATRYTSLTVVNSMEDLESALKQEAIDSARAKLTPEEQRLLGL